MILYQKFHSYFDVFSSNSKNFSKIYRHIVFFNEWKKEFQNKHLQFRKQVKKLMNDLDDVLHKIHHMF